MRSPVSASSVLVTLVAVAALWSSPARAQDLPDLSVPCAPDQAENRRAVLEHEGSAGIWFHGDVARCMLGRLEALPLYGGRVHLLEERLQIGEARTVLLRRQIELAEEGEERAVSALGAAERRAREAEEEASLERSLRWVWFGVGVLVVVIVEALALWAWSELSD
jgi:hypothetical protein